MKNMKSSKLLMKNLIHQKLCSIQYQARDISKEGETENKDSIKCSKCLETFRTVIAKKRHEKFFHFFSKPLLCECGQQFGKLCELNYHVRRVHNKEKNYVCNVCKKAFFKLSDLNIHQSVHETSAKFICEDCGRNFKHVSNLIRHSRTHTGVKPYLCLPCNKRFSQVTALRQHEVTEKHKEKVAQENKVKDSKTLSSTKSRNTLTGESEYNIKTGVEKRKWWFYCRICGERFPFSVLLRDHETKHIANKDIKCNSCKAEFSTIKDFNSHSCKSKSKIVMKNSEIKEKKSQEISTSKNSEGKCVMDKNEEVVTDKRVELTMAQNGQIMLDNNEVLLTLNDKVYGLVLINNDVTVVDNDECLQILNKGQDEMDGDPDFPVMGNIFSMENLQGDVSHNQDDVVHDLILPENWLWSQEECPLEKKSSPAVVSEEPQDGTKEVLCSRQLEKESQKKKSCRKDITAGNGKRKHSCLECKKEFSWSSSLRSHVIKKHTKKKEYSCLKCQKTYYSKLLVEHHIKRDHLNIRSYKCTECGKAFFRRYDLKVHTRIHTDERPYICGVCGKRFRHLSHSIRHDKTHLKESLSEQKRIEQKKTV